MLCIDFERFEFSSAARIELAEEFNKLQPVGVDIRAQRVDADVDAVSDDKDEDEADHTDDAVPHHTADLIEYGSDNAGRKTECQQTAVGKDIAEISCGAVQSVGALCQTNDRILALSA